MLIFIKNKSNKNGTKSAEFLINKKEPKLYIRFMRKKLLVWIVNQFITDNVSIRNIQKFIIRVICEEANRAILGNNCSKIHY